MRAFKIAPNFPFNSGLTNQTQVLNWILVSKWDARQDRFYAIFRIILNKLLKALKLDINVETSECIH